MWCCPQAASVPLHGEALDLCALRAPHRGLAAPQVLCSLVLMGVKNWDYDELRERISDGLTLRQFADLYCDPVPSMMRYGGVRVSN